MPKGSGKKIPQVEVNLKPSSKQINILQNTLKNRFKTNLSRHPNISWEKIQAKLKSNPKKLASINAMEQTGGEPDVIKLDKHLVFIDCSPESPDRRSICYDNAGEQARIKKGLKPGGNAIDLASAMGIELLA